MAQRGENLLETEVEEEEGMGNTANQDQEHTVTREHRGGNGGRGGRGRRLLQRTEFFLLILYYSTICRDHTLSTPGKK